MDVEQITRTTLDEIERLLDTKKVVGEPITSGENTVIPLISFGFGFGAGGGSGKASDKGEGGGGATGGGAGITPVGAVILGPDGVRIEPLRHRTSNVLEKVVDTIGKAAEKRQNKRPSASESSPPPAPES